MNENEPTETLEKENPQAQSGASPSPLDGDNEDGGPTDAVNPDDSNIFFDDLTPEEKFEYNMSKLKTVTPGLHATLERHTPVSELIFLDNGEPAVQFQGTVIYENGAITEAKEQLADTKRNVVRLTVGEVGSGLDAHAKVAYDRMNARVKDAGLQVGTGPSRHEAFFLVVFGIGLAQHLDELVERSACRVLVLVEPNVDMFYHSCYLYDWPTLIERMRERKGIEFILSSDTAHAADSLQIMFRQYNPSGLDGTYVFSHAHSTAIREIERDFLTNLDTAVMGLGFFQDEVNMIGQTYKNLSEGKARLIQRLPDTPGIPCFIVGNGPSLEKLMPFIEKNKDKAVIFACGSALHTLLEAGIQPDFWAISERMVFIRNMADEANQKWGTKDIRFIGSTTIFPGTADFFKEPIYFFRPGLSPAPLFATRSDQIVQMPDPLAANTGLAVAVHLGFREFYFCGVDAGSKYSDRGHAKGGYYEGKHDHLTNLKQVAPANFGGKVYTTPTLVWSREGMEKLIARSRGRVFYNVCDGALIKGATPMHYKAVKIADPAKPKNELVDEFVANCPFYTVDEFNEQWEATAIIDRLPKYCQDLKDAVLDDDMMDFLYARDISVLLDPGRSNDPLKMLVRGTLYGLFSSFEWIANRLIVEDEREVLIEIFKEEYATLVDHMRDRAMEMFTGLEEGMEWEEFEK